MQQGVPLGSSSNGGSRRVGVAQVWVKVSATGEPHAKAAELMEAIKDRYPDAEVRIDREEGYYDRALLRVLYSEGPRTAEVGQVLQELIRDFRGGGDANLLTGKIFSLRVPVGPKGQITDARAQGVIDEIKKQYPKADIKQQINGKVATVDVYLRDIADTEKFMTAYRAIREIVRRHKTEPVPRGKDE